MFFLAVESSVHLPRERIRTTRRLHCSTSESISKRQRNKAAYSFIHFFYSLDRVESGGPLQRLVGMTTFLLLSSSLMTWPVFSDPTALQLVNAL